MMEEKIRWYHYLLGMLVLFLMFFGGGIADRLAELFR